MKPAHLHGSLMRFGKTQVGTSTPKLANLFSDLATSTSRRQTTDAHQLVLRRALAAFPLHDIFSPPLSSERHEGSLHKRGATVPRQRQTGGPVSGVCDIAATISTHTRQRVRSPFHMTDLIEPYGCPTSPGSDGPPASATGDNGDASVTDVCGECGLRGLRNGVLCLDGGRGVNAGAFTL